jgi:hypothetical protein
LGRKNAWANGADSAPQASGVSVDKKMRVSHFPALQADLDTLLLLLIFFSHAQ